VVYASVGLSLRETSAATPLVWGNWTRNVGCHSSHVRQLNAKRAHLVSKFGTFIAVFTAASLKLSTASAIPSVTSHLITFILILSSLVYLHLPRHPFHWGLPTNILSTSLSSLGGALYRHTTRWFCFIQYATGLHISINQSVIILKHYMFRSWLTFLRLCYITECRIQWPRGLRNEPSSLARTLRSWVRIPLKARMYACVYCVCVVLCRLRPCDWLLPRQRSSIDCL
jgi:hypothetical protein